MIRLALVGDNILASRSPALHRSCGGIAGIEITYDLLIPPALGRSFDDVFDEAARTCHGINVTLPYKERVVPKVTITDPMVARIGAVNTVLFGPEGPKGYNTDYSGFIAAYRAAYGKAAPGHAVMIGAGGVGKAVAFGLVALGAARVTVIDHDAARAAALARAVTAAGQGRTEGASGDLAALADADGVINCTPLGMVGYPGSPVPDGLFPKGVWAFDAVYTPAETPFRDQALAAGARFLSGWELFFHQGIDAFEIFTGQRPGDLARLRALLGGPGVPSAAPGAGSRSAGYAGGSVR
ncbi:MAG: hypothetical protein B7Z02_17995 [Rhodobacterales bacterium 32-67-9]|nr:MAG: hypothetical protein B7Z02_17995 [Rhodobacterales bacterium 32-67-9]